MTTNQNIKTQLDENENTFVGIDIAKDELVVHILPTNTQLTVPRNKRVNESRERIAAQ